MEALTRLEQLRDELTRARAVPLSASCVVNRKELLDIVQAAIDALPADLERASVVLAQRDQIVAAATTQAEEHVAEGLRRQAELVREHAVYRKAEEEAAVARAAGEADAAAIRSRADEYVDAKLAQFEVVLSRIATTVADGRARLSGRSDYDALPTAVPAASPVTLGAAATHDSVPEQRDFDETFATPEATGRESEQQ